MLPENWDQSLMYLGLQIIRADPSTAHGTAPGAIMIGRQLVYPCELDKNEIDFEGKIFFFFFFSNFISNTYLF